MDKLQLKQQAKSLLLKGCYKMACNKYSRLIQMGSGGFTQRQWSVVHLNQAISHHFMDQFDQALELSSRAIEIDPTYQKAYYRRIQILRDMRKLDTAINSVPSWIQNRQIEELLAEVREQYYCSLGIDELLGDMSSAKQTKMDHFKKSHLHFYHKLLSHAEDEHSYERIQSIGGKITKYYVQLKKNKQGERLQSFLSIIHMLNVKMREDQKYRNFIETILQPFWKQYILISEPTQVESFSTQLLKKQQFKLIKYAPTCPQVVHFLTLLVKHPSIQSQDIFQCGLQIANNLASNPFCYNQGPQVQSIIEYVISWLSKNMCHARLAWLKRSFVLLDTLVRLHLHFEPCLILKELTLTALVYLRYYYINEGAKERETPIVKVSQLALVEFLGDNLDNFVVLFMFQQFVHKLDRNNFKQIIPAIQEHMEVMKEIAQMQKKQTKKRKSGNQQMQQEFNLVYTSIMLKIDLKHASGAINIAVLLSHKHNRKTLFDQSLSDIILNTLLLLALSNPKNLIEILRHPHSITNIIHEFATNSFIQQLESIGITTSFIYLAIVDLQHEQTQSYAKKMGVSRQEIEKARKIQGQAQDLNLNQQLHSKRQAFLEYAANNWTEIIFNLSNIMLKIKQDISLSKWSKIVNQMAKVDSSHFHHPKVVEVMLQGFKLQKAVVGQFFSILCKKINANLLKYQQMQSIGNILIYNIQNAEHELVIFQSLLGLINLTSNSNCKLKIPIKVLQNCLFEENKYIVHGAFELLNNVLIYVDKEEIDKHPTLKDIIEKYISYYREEVANAEDTGVSLNDYSHPSKVYSTLISLAIVMDLEALEEFQNWSSAQKCLLSIQTPRAVTFFKMAMYLGMKQRLYGKWWDNFEKQMAQLKENHRPYWSKLQQYIR